MTKISQELAIEVEAGWYVLRDFKRQLLIYEWDKVCFDMRPRFLDAIEDSVKKMHQKIIAQEKQRAQENQRLSETLRQNPPATPEPVADDFNF